VEIPADAKVNMYKVVSDTENAMLLPPIPDELAYRHLRTTRS